MATCFPFWQKGNFIKPLTLSARHFRLLCSLLLDEIFRAMPRVYVAVHLLWKRVEYVHLAFLLQVSVADPVPRFFVREKVRRPLCHRVGDSSSTAPGKGTRNPAWQGGSRGWEAKEEAQRYSWDGMDYFRAPDNCRPLNLKKITFLFLT